MELPHDFFKNSFEISTKHEAATNVLVGFQKWQISLLMTITNGPLVA